MSSPVLLSNDPEDDCRSFEIELKIGGASLVGRDVGGPGPAVGSDDGMLIADGASDGSSPFRPDVGSTVGTSTPVIDGAGVGPVVGTPVSPPGNDVGAVVIVIVGRGVTGALSANFLCAVILLRRLYLSSSNAAVVESTNTANTSWSTLLMVIY